MTIYNFEFRYPTEQFAYVHVSGPMSIEQAVQCKKLLDEKFGVSQKQPEPVKKPDDNIQPEDTKDSDSGNPKQCDWCKGTLIWDNRPKKESGEYKTNASDFKCGNKECGSSLWLTSDAWSKPKPKQEDSNGNSVPF